VAVRKPGEVKEPAGSSPAISAAANPPTAAALAVESGVAARKPGNVKAPPGCCQQKPPPPIFHQRHSLWRRY
jgi:hypothetical protein